MEWKDIWIEEPPRNEEIFFMTGDEEIHIGTIFSEEKLRKCSFHSNHKKYDFDCDKNTEFKKRVIYWFPIPKQPERSKREDLHITGDLHLSIENVDNITIEEMKNKMKEMEDTIIRKYIQMTSTYICPKCTGCGALNTMET